MKFNFSISQLKNKLWQQRQFVINPVRDWQVIVVAFILITAGLLAVSGYIYVQIDNGQIFLVKDNVAVESTGIDEVALNSILKSFEAKQIKFNQFRDNKIRLVDPSI